MMNRVPSSGNMVLAFSGGIGGAKLALGLSRVLESGALTIVGNTGDDFEHIGLAISPDIDTLLYTLSGLDDPSKGWGRRDETWTFMNALAALGGATWFQLGDGDLAMHVERTHRLASGQTLSQVIDHFRRRLGIGSRILPMSDDPVRTKLHTASGWLDFQDYFVRLRCEPAITAIEFHGAASARAQPDIIAALCDPRLRAVVICPSNPFTSIDPILAVPGLRQALIACRAPVVAVSPIVAGTAVKGPLAKMLGELGSVADTLAPARRYRDFLDGYVIDMRDAFSADALDIPVTVAQTLMVTLDDRENLARIVLEFADSITPSKVPNSGRNSRT